MLDANKYPKYKNLDTDEITDWFVITCAKHPDLSWLTLRECVEISIYCFLFKHYKLNHHWEINDKISLDNQWEIFREIRSMNNHGNGKIIKGIEPKYFKVVCGILGVKNFKGDELVSFEKF